MFKSTIQRSIHTSIRRLAKNDTSTIDSFRLPSQTSISEWEFKYDFVPKVSEPKIPPISEDAIKQDVAHERKKSVEQEMINEEATTSIKVEGNSAAVFHGGESVAAEPELLHDRGSKPIKITNGGRGTVKASKPANRDQYIQSSANPNLNKGEVSSLGDSVVDHKQEEVKPSAVIDDLDHDNLHNEGQKMNPGSGSNNVLVTLGIFGLGAGSYYYYNNSKKAKA
ncbi:hypothetical protein PSN45_005311 [Yamadazyma tenuis]|uniref:Uncharacterized protein n=1 Tax=Candida tenuis (strain ATCC 10573 / BCRC 21748 / CBS 615 / JCM 9827 / NBRC 10315 / NRRL Y-1498 / VKM Y-70) TaxID=590646 RepID=G3B1E9_CANTC|nr:uncharacterized protein CANTEDRAFT_113701 [Yamadazyma tenuis ATCC 10573]XP_006685761.1 uncharacterized protein CANTEDRAFT_113701 [Yamadazyma tenuis ATCC 10573]EGV64954.1 hypothetical protein CANTEDRAFT_113701 [Yamadazyma tenuis ATCC 10573]EGV64955.1 hypothetical protein CANTEDRAFT_113701 [Yamadazyma tenuis ATCC 10573]WEJ97752.1 hypothetical protein PSN45_005311 [Yamadazyma tenuis]